jgi:concanavalin A-like lectin/glucanase superfamily protein
MPRPFGYAINLGGTDEYSLGSDAVSLRFERTNLFTILGWVKNTSTATSIICGKMGNATANAGYDMSMRGSTGRWQCNLNNSVSGGNFINVSSQTVINDGKWHHVAMCYGGTSTAAGLDMYTDAVLETKNVHTDNLSASIANSNSFLLGGRLEPGLVFPYTGMMTRVSVHSGVKFTAQQVSDAMTKGIGPGLSCVEYLLCGAYATFPTLPDASINATVGTLTNCESVDIVYVTESPPVVSGHVPAVGTPIKPTQAIQFDVTDDYGLAAVIVHVSFGSDRAAEIVHDSVGFRFPYFGTRTQIAGGYRYVVSRTQGWPVDPSFIAHAIDQVGQANA